MLHRYSPYGMKSTRSPPTRLYLWSGYDTQCHPLKQNEGNNADVVLVAERFIEVLDGVSGVAEIGLEPAAMSNELAIKIKGELEKRFDRSRHDPQKYDRDQQRTLKSSVRANQPGIALQCLFNL